MQEKLIILRNRKDWTQKEMADYLGLSLKQYGAKERGDFEFTSDEMFALKNLFGLPLDDIFLPRNHQNGDLEEVK